MTELDKAKTTFVFHLLPKVFDQASSADPVAAATWEIS